MELVNDKYARLDKVVVYGFHVLDIENIYDLIKKNIVIVNLNKDRYVLTQGGDRYSSICIEKNEMFDQFIYGLSKDGHEYGSLQMSVDAVYGNLNCYASDDYRTRIKQVEAFLYEKYKIKVIFDDAKYKCIEINKTIVLNSYFCEYRRVLDLMVSLFPNNLRLRKENDYYRNINSTAILDCKKIPETYSRTSGERGLTIKVYDKSTELQEVYKIQVSYNYLRFEIKLNSQKKIIESIGSNSVWEINDQSINYYFTNFVTANVEKPYIKFCEKRDKALKKIIKSNYIPHSRTWIRDVFITICNLEIDRDIPIILSVDEILPLFDTLPFSSRQCKRNAKQKIKKLAEEKADVFSDSKDKYYEIIQKLK